MRLFIALDLPASISAALAQSRLLSTHGVAKSRPQQMHVTLHFVGDANPDEIRETLISVQCRPCRVSIRGVGQFRAKSGQTILWAGVRRTAELLALHAACGRALAAIGIEPERRPFVPHVTLARLGPSVDRAVAEAFLRAGDDRDFGSFLAERFVLYDSVTRAEGARYDRIASYAMQGHGCDASFPPRLE